MDLNNLRNEIMSIESNRCKRATDVLLKLGYHHSKSRPPINWDKATKVTMHHKGYQNGSWGIELDCLTAMTRKVGDAAPANNPYSKIQPDMSLFQRSQHEWIRREVNNVHGKYNTKKRASSKKATAKKGNRRGKSVAPDTPWQSFEPVDSCEAAQELGTAFKAVGKEVRYLVEYR